MKNLTYNLILLGCLFALTNCKDECVPEKIYLKDLHKYVPYTGTETLRFLHNNTDKQTFVGQGMEHFYVANKRQQDDGCYQDHESVRIRFVNPQTQDEIKMEYLFDEGAFSGVYSLNENTSYKIYYKNKFSGGEVSLKHGNSHIGINNFLYRTNGLILLSLSNDTPSYIYYRIPYDGEPAGILKIKYPSDTLTLIR